MQFYWHNGETQCAQQSYRFRSALGLLGWRETASRAVSPKSDQVFDQAASAAAFFRFYANPAAVR